MLKQSRRFRSTFYGTSRWRSLRAAKLSSVGYRCERCRRLGQRLEVHHREPVNEQSSETELLPDLDALKALCPRCHRAQHRRSEPVPGRAEWRRFVRPF